ncbi:hypothetical protein G7Y89_g4571 [Cudoniella acicularis]|uniref:Uncharacterized protein n=1 Tax=Cudoniella acicularis TaxID=354080 RepID=A0A8H4RQM3_9HELO|nr:hypothetical protein G7Y89_g4571 [Cudoniella acicularis]
MAQYCRSAATTFGLLFLPRSVMKGLPRLTRCFVGLTTRRAQRWFLLSPECRQVEKLENLTFDFKHAFIANSDSCWDAWSKLARPEIRSFGSATQRRTPKIQKESARIEQDSTGPHWLDLLSNEVMDLIIEFLIPEKYDAIALALSSESLWQLVLRQIHWENLKYAAPWAGKKLAFQGSYSVDSPPSFYEDGLEYEILDPFQHSDGGIRNNGQLFFDKHEEFESPATIKDQKAEWEKAMVAYLPGSGIPEACHERLRKEVRGPDLFPRDIPWLLRNLTTREVVSADDLADPKSQSSESMSRVLTLDQILLMRICWTDLWDEERVANLNINRGIWAGHKFDIVPKHIHEVEINLQDWRDVTKEVALEAGTLREKIGELPPPVWQA